MEIPEPKFVVGHIVEHVVARHAQAPSAIHFVTDAAERMIVLGRFYWCDSVTGWQYRVRPVRRSGMVEPRMFDLNEDEIVMSQPFCEDKKDDDGN
jgi:hypothetical protein